jgi:hypothetical protein
VTLLSPLASALTATAPLVEGKGGRAPWTAVTVDPASDLRWDALMAGPRGSLFGSPDWICAIRDTYGFKPEATVLVDASDMVRAGLAHVELDDVLGRRIVSLPYCDRLDPVLDDTEQWDVLVAPLLARGVPFTLRCLDAQAPVDDPRFTVVKTAAWHATDLERPLEDVVASFAPGARQNHRHATRRGVTVRIGEGIEDVRAFHALHRATRKHKYRMVAQPLAFFDAIWDKFSPTRSIFVGLAEHDGDVVAGALYLVWNGTFYYKFGASLAGSLQLRPNEALAFTSIAHASGMGCSTYDWGLSDLDQPGLISYKRKFATSERTISCLRWAPEDWCDPVSDDARRLLSDVTALFTRDDVPEEVTQRAGELLYRFFA